jgi:serine/threonine-protein phosphatase 2B regulatory subunit
LEKLKFAFQVYDSNGDGFISNGDLFASLKLFTGDNLNDIQIQQVVNRIMLLVDKDLDGQISFDEFVDFVQDLRVYELLSMNIFN